MSIEEQIRRIDRLTDYLTLELPKFAQQVAANDLQALVVNRVVQTGLDYRGNRFSDYSTIETLPSLFFDKSRRPSAEKRVRALARAQGVLSYSGFRKLNGLKADKKNFEFTGEMWRKFGIVRVDISGQRFTVSLGGTTAAAQQKIDENSEYENISIIEANAQEEALVQKTVAGWIDRNADRILNG